jgi:NADH pyrophosphatase NudC (nudix superfamily)
MKICGKCGKRHFKRTADDKCQCGEVVFGQNRPGQIPRVHTDGRKFDGNYQFHIDQAH